MSKADIFIQTQEKDTVPLIEKPKKEKKARAPLSNERKQQLRDQLARAREAKRTKNAPTPVPSPAPPKEIEKKVRKPRAKKERNVEPVVPHPRPVTSPKDTAQQELADLRLELSLLKEAGKKREIDDLRTQVQALKSVKPPKLPEPLQQLEQDPVPKSEPIEVKKENYSTYKKSIWAGFSDN
jgi:hypothetical protein